MRADSKPMVLTRRLLLLFTSAISVSGWKHGSSPGSVAPIPIDLENNAGVWQWEDGSTIEWG